MSERLIPYRSQRRLETDGTLALIAAGIAGALARFTFGFEFAGPAALATLLAANLLAVLIARVSALERVTKEEDLKRQAQERAQKPIWAHSFDYATLLGSLVTGGSLLVIAPQHVVYLPTILFGSTLVGAVVGLYLGIDAHRAPAQVDGSAEMSFAEQAAHHFLGYIAGLAAALTVGSFADATTVSAILMLVAFLLAKFITDQLQPHGTSASPDGRLRLVHLLVVFPFGMIWWGIPLGALAVLLSNTSHPDATAWQLWSVFGAVLFLAGFATTLATIVAHLMGLVPDPRSVAAPE